MTSRRRSKRPNWKVCLRIRGGRYLLTVFHAPDLTTGGPKYQFRFTSSLGPFLIAMVAVIPDPRLMLRLLLPIFVSTVLASEKPNIIVILADDHRYDFLSCHPEAPDFLETPNLDRMAKEGAHLKNAFRNHLALLPKSRLYSNWTIHAPSPRY